VACGKRLGYIVFVLWKDDSDRQHRCRSGHGRNILGLMWHRINMSLMRAKREGKRFLNPVPTAVGGLSLMFKIGPKFFFGAKARSPKHTPGPFRTDSSVYAASPRSGLRVTWFGHASSLVEIDGVRVLIDPVWDPRAAPTNWAGPKRFFPPPLALGDLPPIDAVLISHDHFDHLGAGTIQRLAQMKSTESARWITTLGIGKILSGLGVRADRCAELDWTESVKIGSVSVTALPARHFSGRSLFNRFETLWASFALVGPRHRVYYGADSGEWDGFREIGERFGPFDLTMLEIGASNPLWAEIHMGPEGALRSFRALGGQGLFMPIHWGLFDLALHHWTQPIEFVSAVEGLKLWSPTPGVPTEVVVGEQVRSEWWR
jgi:L-ascorbate metabolism protein UlaG (beta-lactamase superfamily)